MREGSIAIIIGLILIGIIIVVITKTTILNYKLGDKGYKALLAVAMIVIALFAAVLLVGTGNDIKSLSYELTDPNTDPHWIAQIKELLAYRKNTFYISTIISCVFLGLYFLLYRNIQKVTSIQQAQAQARKDKWDWKKICKWV